MQSFSSTMLIAHISHRSICHCNVNVQYPHKSNDWLSSLVHVVIVFLWKINNLDQTASKFFQNLPFGCFRIVIILLTVVGLGNHTLYCRLNDIGSNEVAWLFGRHYVLRFDAVIVALIVRSLDQWITFVLGCVSIVVVVKRVFNIAAAFKWMNK